ncbi:putative anti-sigma regulatory factor, serine/threonine protein kinase (plasmid) [Nostoc sp. NIES-3756]|uniref:ATP-binding protein n=1 Tax=Nostoc sp. NIES-3756 TaxID=1751286 RepID=UPI00071F45E6|nr:ATP-binding protein [Nostoc sp. NIES-3756]BAT56899.1 putative anti-sigma regulatory factor, serine/threonine protein kinase [Nostoc sp. NIES-3756]
MQSSLTVPATLDSLPVIANYVMTAAAVAGLDQKTTYNCRLAVDEIATNIITYGYSQASSEEKLNLQADIDEQALTIAIEDTGIAYNPYETHLPNQDELNRPLQERLIGGLGIYLALNSVDEFHYERVGNKNRNVFIVYRRQGEWGVGGVGGDEGETQP